MAEISGLGSGPGPDLEMPRTAPEPHWTPMQSTVWPEGPNRTQSRFGVRAKVPPNQTAPNRGNPNAEGSENTIGYISRRTLRVFNTSYLNHVKVLQESNQ
jgi:hypothetical protein